MRKKTRRRSRGGRSKGCQGCRPAGCRNDDTALVRKENLAAEVLYQGERLSPLVAHQTHC